MHSLIFKHKTQNTKHNKQQTTNNKQQTKHMRTLKQLFLVGAAAALLTSSCTMEKRVYMPGYHIEWNNSKTATARADVKTKDAQNKQSHMAPMLSFAPSALAISKPATEVLTASAEKNISMKMTSAKSFNLLRKASLLSGMSKKEVKHLVKNNSKKAKEMTKKDGGGKSQLIALLLCFFLGGLGIHRFYLGYTTEGIIQLLTAGGCGIWALIDLIRIITGNLKPKDGAYEKTL
jgi:TM2 domain-containing membrane protein YozV